MRNIVITTTSFAEYDKQPLEILKKNKLEITLNPFGRKLKEKEIVNLCKDAIGIIAGTEKLSAEVLSNLPHLKVISRCGVGMDNVDLKAAKELKIKVLNTPDGPTIAVAELTIGLMLDLIRKISFMNNEIRSGHWKKRMGALLNKKRIGIVGFGKIGRKVAELLTNFNCEIAYTDPFVNDSLAPFKKLSLQELITWADIISLHVSTKDRIFGKKEFKAMKKGAWIINVSRGTVIDEQALFQALKNNHLAGAALDVFPDEPYEGPLNKLDNIILTPHIGSYAKEARIKMEIESAENLIKGLTNE